MVYTVEEIRALIEKLRTIHHEERAAKIDSMLIVGTLQLQKAAILFDMNYERFLAYIGLSKNQYWKRSQAAMVCRNYPEALVMLRANEVEMSHLALLCPKITQANKDYILSGIRHASTREVKLLLSTVAMDGRILEREPEFELHIRVTKSQLAVLDRIREVRSHGGHVPSFAEVIVADAEDALEKRDPLRKAQRSSARAAAKCEKEAQTGSTASRSQQSPQTVVETSATKLQEDETAAASMMKEPTATSSSPSPEKGTGTGTGKRTVRAAIPAAVKHAVWQRDQGKCTWEFPDGSRCGAMAMIELDHQKMWCRGGTHQEDNLTLRCRSHNHLAAAEQLGTWFMSKWSADQHSEL